MGARSRRKGVRWEREVASRFREVGIPAERCLTETRDGNVGDLVLPEDVPLAVQCRCGGAPSLWKALQDAKAGSMPGKVPVGLARRSGAGSRAPEDVAVLDLADFLHLVRLLREGGTWNAM